MKHKQIFIGGTGRSGTSILYSYLGTNNDICSLGGEMRFIIDPDGLRDLVDRLTYSFDSVKARHAIGKFEKMMLDDLCSPKTAPYLSIDFPKRFGKSHYQTTVNDFLSKLHHGSFIGYDYQVESKLYKYPRKYLVDIYQYFYNGFANRLTSNHKYRQFRPKENLYIAKYFSNRSELISYAAELVDSLFGSVAQKQNKIAWLEKTPLNLLNLPFLYELFPNSHFIHIKRDPRGVAYSYTNQDWAPSDIESCALLIKSLYRRWLDVRAEVDLGVKKYLEISLEDWAKNTEFVTSQINNFLDVDSKYDDPPHIDIEKVDYWRTKLSKDVYNEITDILRDEILEMGYEL